MKIFLSYAAADRVQAARFGRALQARGFEVWDPATEILPGDNYGLSTGRALEAAEAMVVLISPEAMRSPSVQNEISYALAAPNYANRLIPVIVKPTRDMPWILERFEGLRLGSDAEGAAQRMTDILRPKRKPAAA